MLWSQTNWIGFDSNPIHSAGIGHRYQISWAFVCQERNVKILQTILRLTSNKCTQIWTHFIQDFASFSTTFATFPNNYCKWMNNFCRILDSFCQCLTSLPVSQLFFAGFLIAFAGISISFTSFSRSFADFSITVGHKHSIWHCHRFAFN